MINREILANPEILILLNVPLVENLSCNIYCIVGWDSKSVWRRSWNRWCHERMDFRQPGRDIQHLSNYLDIFLSIYLYIFLSMNLPMNVSYLISFSVNLSIHKFIFLSIYISFFLSIYLWMYLTHIFFCKYIYPSWK